MSGVKWTDEQQNVIDFRNRDILVSAAAGSGKTAVLVERIITRITKDQPPVDIDRMLVVTFTKAAAAEMKERVAAALHERIKEEPENENLMRQSALVHNSMITTIDSFCNYIVRNYFGEIGLDPNFRIADEGEINLLEQDVLAEVFEKNYAREDNEMFLKLVDSYSKKTDSNVRELIYKIYSSSASNPWPKEWIAEIGINYQVETTEELKDSQIIADITEEAIRIIREGNTKMQELLEVACQPDGPAPYIDGIKKYLDMFKGCEDFSSVDDVINFFGGFNKFSIGRCSKGVNPEKKEQVQNGANDIAKNLVDYKNKYFSRSLDELLEQLKRMRPLVDEISRLTLEYYDDVSTAKRERRIVDFSDVEHFALNILVDEKTHKSTDTARAFRKHYAEIMIDEYQDSNMVQEQILKSISGAEDGNNNMFMVGDVKQSIYRFRLAEPELFMEKYKNFSSEESKQQKIDLAMNFRSRREVLDFSNDIFYKIMSADLGSVAYDKKVALNYGAGSAYPDNPDMEAEILLVDMKDEMISEAVDDQDSDSKRIEALMIAHKILDMKDNLKVIDKATKEARELKFSDIVILVRSTKTSGETFSEILNACGVPTYVESSQGYFSSFEIQVIMSLLQLLDNPLQDIPMATLLKSPIVGMDDEELAEIRVAGMNKSFAQSAWDLMNEKDEEKDYSNEKLEKFFDLYSELRSMIYDTPIHELIQKLLDRTDFLNYAASMPSGQQRYNNIKMLIEKAVAYEQTSYKGLYHFVRYINLLKKYDVDYGEADTLGENSDVVRIMTIHKSKGLEFPVVFVSGMGRKFDMRDSNGDYVVHSRKRLGINEMSSEPKVKRNCMITNYIAEINKRETLGEELRVLYVALTRAKEKLIITGHISDAEKEFTKHTGNAKEFEPISRAERIGAGRFIDWIIPAVQSYGDKYSINIISPDMLAERVAVSAAESDLSREMIMNFIEKADESLIEQYTKEFEYEYPHSADIGRKMKYSVSDIKMASMAEKLEEEHMSEKMPFHETVDEVYVPAFAMEDGCSSAQVNQGALRGTAVHRFMECLDFKAILDIDISSSLDVSSFVGKEIDRQLKTGKITEEMKELIMPSTMEVFVTSNVCHRMAVADSKGLLFREKPFVMKHDEGFLVQGIIDVFWLEGDRIVLLDYKTDNVKDAAELILKYETQLLLYADALRRIFSTKEKNMLADECLLYSFKLQEEIRI